MQYLSLPAARTRSCLELLLADQPVDVAGASRSMGLGTSLDYRLVETLSDELQRDLETFCKGVDGRDLDRFEGRVGARLHQTLGRLRVPPLVLDDPGFWAFLSLEHFWWLVVWRHGTADALPDLAKLLRYVDGTSSSECLLLRAFVRAHTVADPDSGDRYRLADAMPRASDFWRSHVLRVRTGSSPVVVRALAEEQLRSRMSTDELREFARRLNRTWANVVPHVLDEDDVHDLFAALR